MLSGSQKIRFKSLSTRAPGSHLISMNFSSQRVYPKTQTDKLASVFFFLAFTKEIALKKQNI